MTLLRRRIDPKTFVITRKQLAIYLKLDGSSILNWEKWPHVLWVHIQGRGGYFISYRQLQQWVTACCVLILGCQEIKALKAVWSALKKEAKRYTEQAIALLYQLCQQRQAYLLSRSNSNTPAFFE